MIIMEIEIDINETIPDKIILKRIGKKFMDKYIY